MGYTFWSAFNSGARLGHEQGDEHEGDVLSRRGFKLAQLGHEQGVEYGADVQEADNFNQRLDWDTGGDGHAGRSGATTFNQLPRGTER